MHAAFYPHAHHETDVVVVVKIVLVLTEQRHVIGSPWYRVGDIDEEETKREKGGDPDVDLLRGNTVEDREKHGGSEDPRKYDVHDVERVTSTEVYSEGNVGEPLMRATFEVEFIPNGGRLQHIPFSVCFVGVEADLDGRGREVHLGGVVGPSAEDQLAMLGIERVVVISMPHIVLNTPPGSHRIEPLDRRVPGTPCIRHICSRL